MPRVTFFGNLEIVELRIAYVQMVQYERYKQIEGLAYNATELIYQGLPSTLGSK
jgi:hypothetical protein